MRSAIQSAGPITLKPWTFFPDEPLTCFDPEREALRALPLAIEAGRAGGIMPTVFNAANEVADDAFIKGQIPFLAMADLIEAVLSKVDPVSPLSY